MLFSCVSTENEAELVSEYYNVGSAFFEIEQYEKAIEYYDKVLNLDKDMHKARYNLVHIYVATSDFDRAFSHINYLKERDEVNQKVKRLEAFLLYKYGDLSQSLELYSEVLKEGDVSYDVKLNIAKLHYQLEHYGEAITVLDDLLSSNKSKELFHMAGLSAEKNEEKSLAAQFYESALELGSDDMEILESLHSIYNDLSDYENLKNILELLLDTDKNEKGEIYFELGEIALFQDNNYKIGYDYLVNAADSGFDDETKIENLLNNPDLLEKDKIRDLFVISEE